jgi:hypothetical protein
MVLRRNVAVRIAFCALLLPIGFDVFTRIDCYGGYGWFDIFVLGPSLLIAVICSLLVNPLQGVGASLGLTAALAFAYNSECVRPYVGGGASFIGLIMLFVCPILTGVGALIFETLSMMFRLKISESPVGPSDAL